MATDFVTDPFPSDDALRALWRVAWGNDGHASFQPLLKRSLAHVCAYAGGELVGFVNVAWDGGIHAFILDTCVAESHRRQGIALGLVEHAVTAARQRGAEWLHVDFEPHLEGFYRQCGFRATGAGLMKL